MITIDYHPLVNAIVDSWRANLSQDNTGRPAQITDDDLKELIRRLCVAIEALAESMSLDRILHDLQAHNESPLESGICHKQTGCVIS